jgi:hypothetical protein
MGGDAQKRIQLLEDEVHLYELARDLDKHRAAKLTLANMMRELRSLYQSLVQEINPDHSNLFYYAKTQYERNYIYLDNTLPSPNPVTPRILQKSLINHLHKQAEQHIQEGHYEEARTVLLRILKLDMFNQEAQDKLKRLETNTGTHEKETRSTDDYMQLKGVQ